MEEFIAYLIAIPLGIFFIIQLVRWIWTAPREFVRLLRQGPSPKLTFVFIGIGLTVAALIFIQSVLEIPFQDNPGAYFLGIGGSAAIAGILYHIFLSTKYQTVGYFFIIIFKILLVVIPTILISILSENIVWGFTYFFIMLLTTYYSVYRINTKSSYDRGTMTGDQTVKISTSRILKYLASSLFQAVLGYFISQVLASIF